MKISDIPAFMGSTAAALAAHLNVSKQTLQSYTSGKRGKPSKFVTDLLIYCGLNREEIIFPDLFDCPEGSDPDSPIYWANVALEALAEAEKRGLPEQEAKQIAQKISEAVRQKIAY